MGVGQQIIVEVQSDDQCPPLANHQRHGMPLVGCRVRTQMNAPVTHQMKEADWTNTLIGRKLNRNPYLSQRRSRMRFMTSRRS